MALVATIKQVDQDHCIAVWNQTLIQVWRRATIASAMAGMVDASRALIAGALGQVTSISIIEEGSAPPGERALKVMADWSRDLVPNMAAAVVVAEGNSFRTAFVRAGSVALSTLAPQRMPFKIFAHVDDAVTHLSPHLPGGSEALRNAIVELRRHLSVTYP